MKDGYEGPDACATSDSSETGGDPPWDLAGAKVPIPSPLPDRPPQAVGFLLSQLGFETSRRFHILMAEVDLDPRQFALMRAIDAADGPSQNAVSEWLRIPPSSMVAVVDSLEARGLVERRPHPSDRRARTLHLTGEGQKVLENAREHAMALEQAICAGFSTTQRQKLIGMLADVSDNLGLVQGLHPGMAGHQDSPREADIAPQDAGSSRTDA